MKLRILIPLAVIAIAIGWQSEAQNFAYTSLHIFSTVSVSSPHTNTDGSIPHTGLALFSNTLYGTTYTAGSAGYGTIFRLNTDGSSFTNLYSFTNGADGGNPSAGCVLAFDSNSLFGVTGFGGTNIPRAGAVFRIYSDGTGFTNLHSFRGSDGQNPTGGLIVTNGILYGTTVNGGGTGKHGTVFSMNEDGSGFTNLYAFSTTDGSSPAASLMLSGNTLFGTTFHGNYGAGSVFRINTDGSAFTNLFSFNGSTNGSYPYGSLVLSGNWLFGTTSYGGAFTNFGVVYRINTDGTGFTNLHNFTSGSDAGSPMSGLVLVGDTLYGTALVGYTNFGIVYAINTDGTGFTNIYNFSGGSDGGAPGAPLIVSGNTFYGSTDAGGSDYGTNGSGVVFALTFPVSLALVRSNVSCAVSWPAPSTGFILQQNGDLATTNWTNSSAFINDNGTTRSVTHSTQTGNLFFRLKHSYP